MAVDNWPASLPRCMILGSESAMGDGLLRSEMDQGPAKIRRRSSSMPRPLSGEMRMTGAQVRALQAFVGTVLAGGALPFSFPDPHSNGPPLLVRFREMPSWSRVSTAYSVRLALEILP